MAEHYKTYIEGVDCSGKTSVGKAVAQRLGVTNVGELFIHNNNPWNAEVTKEVSTDHPLFIAYLFKAAIWDILNFDPTQSLMQISFVVYRSTAYQLAFNINNAPSFESLLEYVPKFGRTIILDASVEARQERLYIRSSELGIREISKNDALIFKNPGIVDEMGRIIKEKAIYYLDATVLDTTNNTLEETIDSVHNLVTSEDQLPTDNRHENIRIDLPILQKEMVSYVGLLNKRHSFPESQISRILEPILIPTAA